MPRKSNFCETHNQIHHCEFTSVTFVAKKQEELISKRMNRLLNPSEYINKPSEDLKPKKGSFAHIIQNAKTRNEKLKTEVNFKNETNDEKIDEKTLANRIEKLKKNVLQNSNSSVLQVPKKEQKNSKVKKLKKQEEINFSNPSATIQLTVEQTQELINKAVKKALKDLKEK